MNSTKIVAYLTVRHPDWYQSEKRRESVSNMIQQFSLSSGRIHLPLRHDRDFTPEIALLNEEEAIEHGLFTNARQSIKVSGEIVIPNTPIYLKENHGKLVEVVRTPELELHYKRALVSDFRKRLFSLLIAANLADIGSLNIIEARFEQDDDISVIGGMHEFPSGLFDTVVDSIETLSWHTLQNLDLVQVWNWLAKDEGFIYGIGDSPINKALVALTYLFLEDELGNPASLIWSLYAIEALYGRARSVPTEQLKERISMFLGTEGILKNHFAKLYSMRSKFVHGALSFPSPVYIQGMDEGLDKSYNEFTEATNLAIGILMSTIRELIRRDWRGLDFTCQVTDIPKFQGSENIGSD